MDPRTIKMLSERGNRPEPDSTTTPPAKAPDTRAKLQAWVTANQKPVAIGASALVIAVWVGYYALVTLPAKEQQQRGLEQQAQQQQAEEQDLGLQTCLADADAVHTADLDNACKAKKQGADCSLSAATTDSIDRRRLDARIDCIKKYMPK